MITDAGQQPGAGWLDVVHRPTLAAFCAAFGAQPVLEATAVGYPLRGVCAIFHFFGITRSMYERIAFTCETRSASTTCLEWEGVFQGKPVSGATLLKHGPAGDITAIRLYHFPHEQLEAFSAELARRVRAESIGLITPGDCHEDQR
jgi:hypothetical protein